MENAGAGHGIRRWEAGAFGCRLGQPGGGPGLTAAPAGRALFSAHMAQHELLMVVAAPLLVLGRPIVAFLWAVPMPWRRAAGNIVSPSPVQAHLGALTLPAVAWTVHAVAIWLWHVPGTVSGHAATAS